MVTKQQWVEALRSGAYKQGQGSLCRRDPADRSRWCFCVLGVLCDLDAIESKNNWELGDRFAAYGSSTLTPPWHLASAVGFSYGDLLKFSILNDKGTTFATLATAIETYRG